MVFSMQLTPTGSFSYAVGATAVGQIISLDLVTGGNWHAHKEHWFRNSGIDFATAFGSQQTLTIVPGIQCGTPSPCTTLQTLMDQLSPSWGTLFQMYAIGVLKTSNWTKTRPTLGTRLYSFAATGTDDKRPRVVFDVDAVDGTKLNAIVWLTEDNTLSTFPVQTLTLPYEGAALPTATYYYVATR